MVLPWIEATHQASGDTRLRQFSNGTFVTVKRIKDRPEHTLWPFSSKTFATGTTLTMHCTFFSVREHRTCHLQSLSSRICDYRMVFLLVLGYLQSLIDLFYLSKVTVHAGRVVSFQIHLFISIRAWHICLNSSLVGEKQKVEQNPTDGP